MRIRTRITSCVIAIVALIFGIKQWPTAISASLESTYYVSGYYVSQDLVLFYTNKGLFKATNEGWQQTSWPQGNKSISLGGAIYTYYNTIIQQSLDGGVTWSATGTFTITDYAAFSLLSASPLTETLFMRMGYTYPDTGPVKGIYKSTDSGATWNKVFDHNPGNILFSPNFAQDGTAFAEIGGYLWKTVDWGETWFRASEVRPSNSDQLGFTSAISPTHTIVPLHADEGNVILTGYTLAISPQFTQDHTLFAFNGYNMLKSTDAGDSWYLLERLFSYLPTNIAVSPNYLYDQTLLIGDRNAGLFLSRDGGDSWQQLPNTTPCLYYEARFVGIRQVAPYQPWPPVPPTPSPPAGPHRVYLPFVSQQTTPQLELWVVAASADEIILPYPTHLHRSYDFGATWEELFVFERSHWLYLPLVTHTTGEN